MYDINKIRNDFPILKTTQNGKSFVYLDTAATAQKPKCVINKIGEIYSSCYANVHRGDYAMAEDVTAAYEQARDTVREFLNANSSHEIVFTRNATEAINLVAATWGQENLKAGDEILLSEAEHHANLIPWQITAQKTGAELKIFKINDDGSYNAEEFEKALSSKVKLVSVTAMSNVLGTIFPIKKMATAAHAVGAKILVDACQSAVHQKTDVQDLNCDFLAFSGHKLYGPTGIGVLYAKSEILNSMPPYQTGGDMVDKVTYLHTTYAKPPARFEAGTPAIVEAITLQEAIKYVSKLSFKNIMAHEKELLAYFDEQAKQIKGLKIIGTAPNKGGVICFDFKGIHPQDLSFILAHEGVAIRIGHHCAEPLVERMGYASLARVSFGLYTSESDIDAFFEALHKVEHFF
ncbi:MAG: SufS family cysteine desulfurase [Alphaproteobacteria bacterium]|nr:SufS family cysteine desulfurase [Alphaproteobacteria bacterium]